jgi:hypothetical protein
MDKVIAQGTQSVAQQIPGQLTHDFDNTSANDPAPEPEEPVATPVQATEPEVFSPEPEVTQTSDPILKNFLDGGQ